MKLIKKNFGNLKFNLKKKFKNCTPYSLKRGDYLQISFVLKNQKRKRGLNLRINKQTGILLRKLIKFNSMSIILSIMFKFEKVKFYFNLESPQMVKIKFINKKLRNKYLLKKLI